MPSSVSGARGLGRSIGRRCIGFLRRCIWACTRFCGLAWPGAVVGVIIAALFFPTYGGFCMGTGLGTAVDAAGCLIVGVIAFALVTLLLMLILSITRRMPLRFVAVTIATVGILVALGGLFGLNPDLTIRLGGPLIVFLGSGGAAISILLRRSPGRVGVIHAAIASLMLFLAVVVAVSFTYWLARPGQDPFLKDMHPVAQGPVPQLDAPDPSQTGSHEVATLCYGSGTDRRRPEYGEKVDLKTDPVDASAFVVKPGGFKGWARKRYWGFDSDNVPLNARVWFPKEAGPFPLVLMVHGNHKMEEFSDPGYAYLGELLASRGYIAASVDENFLNFSWSGDLGGENDARGWLLLKHLELWRAWNEQKENPFYHKTDLSNIALIGHSRGGEAILHAAAFNGLTHYPDDAKVLFDFDFAIKTLIAIAPIDGQYEPMGMPVPVENVNYLALQGSHDADVDFFAASRTFRRIAFNDGGHWMKAALYIYRANHGQFNAVWGKYDVGPPLKHVLARGALLSEARQQTIAKVYISAFLDATLQDRSEYIPMFRDHACAQQWLPDTIYFSRFEDSNFIPVATFDESIDVTATTVAGGSLAGANLGTWRHQEIKGRDGWPFNDYAAVLGWNTGQGPPSSPDAVPGYTISLPQGFARGQQLGPRALLSFCLADTGECCPVPMDVATEQPSGAMDSNDVNRPAGEAPKDDPNAPIDFTVELVASDGSTAELPLSHIRPLQRILKVTFTKWPHWERIRYQSATEPVLQTYEIPLSDFIDVTPTFDPTLLSHIRFRFDRTRSAVILLDHVGFAQKR